MLVFRLHTGGHQLIVGRPDVRGGVAVAVDRALALGVHQRLQVAGNGLHEHEALGAKHHHGIAHMQATALPHLGLGDPGAEDTGIVGAGLLQVADQNIDVAEFQIHGLPSLLIFSKVQSFAQARIFSFLKPCR